MAVGARGRPADVDHRRVSAAPDGRAGGGRPASDLNLANLLSALRIVLVVPILLLLLGRAYGWAAALFALAALTDALDGLLARRLGLATRLGAVLDPLADKLLMTGALLTLTWQELVPVWLVALVLARDVLVAVGALALQMGVSGFAVMPSLLGKAATAVQLSYVGAVLVDAAEFLPIMNLLAAWLLPLLVLLTLVSAAAYLAMALRRLPGRAARS
ncbi:MAG TPA: CDP-alcohol phosphatidyltransferase family protein [Geminicoccus sp.]|uniref:CDP-alcohol phosphatidyltransferase family protein n=1 Tax=Geminicoccus sp. TaxID=2024832 RepID=UPI002C1A4072|nr:CDP-alcohol phosphatidyltransferase family protein [Geminicoccus sp.]HWL68057.1 CDP-alcohol phosphatidyltransferase family protein [Geminicoccus sp.]